MRAQFKLCKENQMNKELMGQIKSLQPEQAYEQVKIHPLEMSSKNISAETSNVT